MSMPDVYKEREMKGLTPQGFLSGQVLNYFIEKYDTDVTMLSLSVTNTDLKDLKHGDVVKVSMNCPQDANFIIKDLMNGYEKGDIDPVPCGSHMTFHQCELTNKSGFSHSNRIVDAGNYDVSSIERFVSGPKM